jgi:hypothetical protein
MNNQQVPSECPSSPGSPTLDDESLAACAWAEVQVQAALKALLDKVGIGGDLHRRAQAGDWVVAKMAVNGTGLKIAGMAVGGTG